MDAIILAGGKGKRMNQEIPKPLILVNNKPMIQHQIDYLIGSGLIKNIIVSISKKHLSIKNFVEKQYFKKPGKNIKFSIENSPLGTAGGLKMALKNAVSEIVLVLNCDDFANIDIKAFLETSKNNENVICAANPRLDFGRVMEIKGYAVFEEKPILKNEWVNCGWYLLNRQEMQKILPEKGSLEYDIFPNIKMKVYKHTGFWMPINTIKDAMNTIKDAMG